MTGYLLDTNVISETNRPKPSLAVAAFLNAVLDDHLFVSAITFGELRREARIKARSDREAGELIHDWIDSLEAGFHHRILSVDLAVASTWARITAARSRPLVDSLLAATAIVNDLAMVTRNVRDFQDFGITVIDPWTVT